MTKLPEKDLLSGSKTPRTTTGEMKSALGRLRDFLSELFGDDSSDKETARQTLGIDLSTLANRMEMETALSDKVDKSELALLESDIAKRGTPVGTIEYFARATPPAGYLKADGSTVGRQTYPDLFTAIGSTFGEGDGETTFNLPDLMNRFAQGSLTPGQKVEAGLPNATGGFTGFAARKEGSSELGMSGMFHSGHSSNIIADPAAGTGWFVNCSIETDLSRSNAIYGASNTVQPPALTLLPCIKAFDAANNPGLIDISGLAQETAGKIDKTIDGIVVKYVTETFNDGTNWYRKWSDGWLEQGGVNNTGTSGNVTITFLKPYQSIPRVMAFGLEASPTTSWWMSGARTPTTLSADICSDSTGMPVGIEKKGSGKRECNCHFKIVMGQIGKKVS